MRPREDFLAGEYAVMLRIWAIWSFSRSRLPIRRPGTRSQSPRR